MYQTIKIVDIVEKEYFISTIRTIRINNYNNPQVILLVLLKIKLFVLLTMNALYQ